MELTPEQHEIINSIGNIKINAVAGAGKTTTIIEYAKARPKESKILYLAFNKSVKTEANKKFANIRLNNAKAETAHSLAYKQIVFQHNYKVRNQDYKTYEIVELLNLQGNGEKHNEYIIANRIKKFAAYFCNSEKSKIQELNYLNIVNDSKAKAFVSTFYTYIENQTRVLLSKMDKGEVEITHDFYLKKFQLSNPNLHYDYILFDEAQDASPAMLDVFFKQKATKVIVGDTHQQIYGWRFAVNSLEKANFKTFKLSTSFRFGQDIANLAADILNLKTYLNKEQKNLIIGKGNCKDLKTKAVLARTNFGLLLKAIEYVTENRNVSRIYFEGNISSYTYADEGTSLYDVLNLYNHKNYLIKDKLIKAMKGIDELEDYVEKTDDLQLGSMIKIVKQYGDDIHDIIKDLKNIRVDEKEKAELIFSTIHRSKGMEYDSVELVNDFITEKELQKSGENKNKEESNADKLNEEINLLYVAVTRTKNCLYIPEDLIPANFTLAGEIYTTKDVFEEDKSKDSTNEKTHPTTTSFYEEIVDKKSYNYDEVRIKHKDAYMPWTIELDNDLTKLHGNNISINNLAKYFNRTTGAIASRIKKLGLI